MTKEMARQHFAAAGLTYVDITSGEILALVLMLNKRLKSFKKENCCNMRLSDKMIVKYRSNGTIVKAFLFVNSDHFTRRECISFNVDGFIGFAGWADGQHAAPILEAFVEWVDAIKERDIS